MEQQLLKRFLSYVVIDTQSDSKSQTFPSTQKQFDLAKILVDELKSLGLKDATVDEHCQVTATLEGNLFNNDKVPVVGFIAHMDTSESEPGTNVKPIVHENYQGGNIKLKGIEITEKDNLKLRRYIGHKLVTSDGTTLLGADDKAGIAEIMSALEYLQSHSDDKHGHIKVAFTPDEEVGKSTTYFDVKKFGAKYAYTVDGTEVGEIEDETFNAAKATFKIFGWNEHPGYAKGKLVNSQKIAASIVGMIPHEESPEMTEEDQGFYHIIETIGKVDVSTIDLIIRDFDRDNFERRKKRLWEWQNQACRLYEKGTIILTVEDQYRNMKEVLDKYSEVTEIAVEATKRVGIEVVHKKVRGGTDGASLSFMGLPTPNLFAGGLNFHSKSEFIPVSSMVYATQTLIQIPQIYAQRYQK
jgi:tripeptide aminopeptidase